MFCKYDNVFFFSWLFKSKENQKNTPQHPIFRRLAKGLYLFISWSKARVLYYANNWIYTTNHKRIAVNYFWFVILSGIFGMVLATVIRLELAYPGVGIFAGDSLQYLSLATAHGVIMVFFMIIPLISGAFANFLLPTQLGVHDVAFPRLNSAAFWFLPGGLMMLGQLICLDRRYQRMNCFNIREAQSLLKKRFFVDLINSNDHHTLLDKTMIGLRFKTNDFNTTLPQGKLSSTFGLSTLLKTRTFNSIEPTSNLLTLPLVSLQTSIIEIIDSRFKSFFNLPSFFSTALRFLSQPIQTFSHFFSTSLNNLITFDTQIFSASFILTYISNLYYSAWIYLCVLNINLKTSFVFFWIEIKNNTVVFSKILNTGRKVKNTTNEIFFAGFDSTLFFIEINHIWETNRNYFFNYVSQLLIFAVHNSITRYSDWELSLIVTMLNQYDNVVCELKKKLRYRDNMFYKFTTTNDLFYRFFTTTQLVFKQASFDGIVAVQQISRSFYAYWGACLNVIRISFDFSAEFARNYNNSDAIKVLHKDYSDFLSLWYFPVLFNADRLSVINLTALVKFARFFNDFTLNAINNAWYDVFSACNYFFVLPVMPFGFKKVWADDIKTSLYIQLFNAENFKFWTVVLNPLNALYSLTTLLTIFNFKSHLLYVQNNLSLSTLSTQTSNLTSSLTKLFENEESLNQQRGLRFNSPVFGYDYKTGDYFPKFYKENITYLFSTFGKITGSIRTPSWFLSEGTKDAFTLDLSFFAGNGHIFKKKTSFFISPRLDNRSNHTFFFYNFFTAFGNSKSRTAFYWTPFASLTQKFENMFVGTSMQERMYTNWRQLKFTREAWRCKLLIARHQKSLFRRYVRETGLFWAIERNARDLLPGWAMITPFSSRSRFTAIGKVDIGVSAILLVLISSIISGANFLVTYRYLSTLNNRKMRDARSFFTEGIMCSSWMMIAANPMLIIGLIMLLCDRHWQTSFFDYSGGGDTILFQHMFWFFGHPEVYIVIIPTFGFVNTLFSYYLRKRISARASLLYSIYTIAFLGFFVWGHHMYMVGLSHTTRMLFSTLTVMISVPAATKLMHWCVTLVNSSFIVELPFLFMLTYVFLFVSGGISGMCVAHTGMDILFHDTFYVIGHFHVMFAGAAMFGCFGAFYFYFSAIFGVKYSRVYAYMHFTYYLLGQLLTVIPMFWLGYAGMPRRVLDYPSAFGGWHSIITAGHMLSVAGLISFFMMIFDSLRQSKAATRTNLGIIRYNTRLNFYFYEASRISFNQQKGNYLYRYFRPTSFKLNGFHYTNYEYLETTLYSYTFNKRL